MTATLFAQADFFQAFYFALRLAVAVGAGILGWFLAAPVAIVVHRMVFRKPISKRNLFVVRLIAAILLALLAFLLIPIGPGGGWGPGGGADGPGKDGGKNGVTDKPTTKEPTKPTTKPQDVPKEVLEIALVDRDSAEAKVDKFYLVQRKEPAKTIREVEQFLKETEGRWSELKVILYKTSFFPKDFPVQALEDRARQFSIATSTPKEYWTKERK